MIATKQKTNIVLSCTPSTTNTILLEGMDLAGKSTIINLLQKRFADFKVRHLSLSFDNDLYDFAKKLNKSDIYQSDVVGTAYLTAIKWDVYNYSKNTDPVLQDSIGLLRSLAHHTAYGNHLLVDHLKGILEIHPKFNSSIVFTANLEDRKQRLTERIKKNPTSVSLADRLILKDPDLFMHMNDTIIYYATKHFNAHVINTSYLNIDETFKLVLSKIQ